MSTTQIEIDDSYTASRRGFDNSWSYELNSRTPVQLSWKQMVPVTLHWRCLTLTILLLICFSMLVWCKIPTYVYGDFREPCRNGLIWVPATITLVFYLLYLVECFHCTIHRGFDNLISAENAELILRRWINAKAIIRWRAVCYHYGRNFRQRYTGGSSGPQTVPQLQYTRINSHSTEGRYYPYDCGCLDKSTPLRDISRFSVIKVDIEKTFSFGCSCSEAAYFTQRKAFYERHVHVDDFIELSEIFHLAGSQIPDSLCIVKTDKGVPWYCRKFVFWMFSLLCLSWPIRIVIERGTAYAAVTIHKEFGGSCEGVLATSGHSLSSYDSKISENIYGVIPSYSEALLMSTYTLNGTRVPSTITISNRKRLVELGAHGSVQPYGHASHSTWHKHTNKAKSLPSKHLYHSKTADNLLSVNGGGYDTIPRSLSLYSPKPDRGESSLYSKVVSAANTAAADSSQQIQSTSTSRKYKSSSNVVNSIKQILTPSQRSKTFNEQIHLL